MNSRASREGGAVGHGALLHGERFVDEINWTAALQRELRTIDLRDDVPVLEVGKRPAGVEHSVRLWSVLKCPTQFRVEIVEHVRTIDLADQRRWRGTANDEGSGPADDVVHQQVRVSRMLLAQDGLHVRLSSCDVQEERPGRTGFARGLARHHTQLDAATRCISRQRVHDLGRGREIVAAARVPRNHEHIDVTATGDEAPKRGRSVYVRRDEIAENPSSSESSLARKSSREDTYSANHVLPPNVGCASWQDWTSHDKEEQPYDHH